jgi:hypothetical protein
MFLRVSVTTIATDLNRPITAARPLALRRPDDGCDPCGQLDQLPARQPCHNLVPQRIFFPEVPLVPQRGVQGGSRYVFQLDTPEIAN